MPVIKIPVQYTYQVYPFSREATEYSKKLAARKASKTDFIMAILLGIIALLGCSYLFISVFPSFSFGAGNIVFIALGIWAGVDVDRMINAWYESRIEQALKKAVEELAAKTASADQ